MPGASTVTPLLTDNHQGDGTDTQAPKTWHILDCKMQYQWCEDMLDKEKCMILQSKMDAFLGKCDHRFNLPPWLWEPFASSLGMDPFMGNATSVMDNGHL